MKTLIIILLSIISIATQNKHELVVYVDGIVDLKGDIYVGLYNKPEGFTELNAVYQFKITPAMSKSLEVKFLDIPEGIYAVSVFHDKNSNGKLDKNIVGYPVEVYGFSNNQRALFSAPSFEDCSFRLKNNKSLEIHIQ